MSLGNPWALFGLLGVAVPLVIHLFGRQQARRQRFPTLRFLATSRLMPTRRRRLTDLLLLAVRMGIVALAALALTQPRFDDAGDEKDVDRVTARAIVVDTSASMMRLGADGTPAIGRARREGARLAAEAQIATTIETADPAAALAGVAAWLDRQPGMRELVIVSDFQLGGLDSIAIASIPVAFGVKLIPIVVVPGGATPVRTGNRVAHVRVDGDRTTVDWTARDRSARSTGTVQLLAGESERQRASAALAAADAVGGTGVADSTRPVAIIYKEHEGRAELLRNARPLGSRWMGDAVVRLHADPALIEAAGQAEVASDTSSYGSELTVVARTNSGLPAILASRGTAGSVERLDLWMLADAGSLTSAALIAAVNGAMSPAFPVGELEPGVLSLDALRRLERPPGTVGQPPPGSESGARWFWIAVLVLLGIEQVLRGASRNGLAPSMASLSQDERARDQAA